MDNIRRDSHGDILSKAIIKKVIQFSPAQKKELLVLLQSWKINDDKRDSKRQIVKAPVDYSINDKFYSDILDNLSAQGAFINTSLKFDLGDHATMMVSLPGLGKSIKSKGKIVRHNDSGIAVMFFDKLPKVEKNSRIFYE